MTKLGKITISKVTSNERADYITIRLNVEGLAKSLVVIEMGLEAFAQTITGMGRVDCQFLIEGSNDA